jgi:glycerophosphoryl diester phosphodiesterase
VETVRAHGLTEDVTFTSFLLERLATVRGLGKDLQLGAILPNPTDFDLGRAVAVGATSIGVEYRNVCLRIVEAAHHVGLGVRAWNPDTWREQAAMIALGVDGVGTNRPDIVLSHLQDQADTPP